MASASSRPELLVIVGPTASGKSKLAMRAAKQFQGEIITADSRTIYKEMDIGTAKPSRIDQAAVPHWGVDLIQPGKRFSVAKFKKYAEATISSIHNRGKLPILVGGSGLYVDSVLFDFSFVQTHETINRLRRLIYSSWSLEKLQKIIQQRDWLMPENSRNRRHLIRTLERKGQLGNQKALKYDALIIGLDPGSEKIKQNISRRTEQWFREGLLDETKSLYASYEDKFLKTAGIGYKACAAYLNNQISLDEAKTLFKKEHWQYARRQRTWFKRNPSIKWFSDLEQAYKAIVEELNN